jgi:hypothetical protein
VPSSSEWSFLCLRGGCCGDSPASVSGFLLLEKATSVGGDGKDENDLAEGGVVGGGGDVKKRVQETATWAKRRTIRRRSTVSCSSVTPLARKVEQEDETRGGMGSLGRSCVSRARIESRLGSVGAGGDAGGDALVAASLLAASRSKGNNKSSTRKPDAACCESVRQMAMMKGG